MQNCGVSRLPLDFKGQYFGCEIEMTGPSRATAAHALADLFGTRSEHSGGGYDAYRVLDSDGKEWLPRIVWQRLASLSMTPNG